MFTGIVERLAEVIRIESTASGKRLTVKSGFGSAPDVGASVSVNGVCLTIVQTTNGDITFDAVDETLQRSNLGSLATGDRVNLERPMAAAGRFDGHVVQGHVDGCGVLLSIHNEGGSQRVRVELAPELSRYVVEKGSITVDGVSLTVTAVGDGWFEFVLIPHTISETTFAKRSVGEKVNLEVDVIAKYVERLMEAHS